MSEEHSRVLIAVPTLNELGNIEELLRQILTVVPCGHVLVIDDNSDDGTIDVVERFISSRPDHNVILQVRERRLGVGSAHKFALSLAKDLQFEVLVTLDADFTHDPRYIPKFLAGLEQADVVVGSRFLTGGGLKEWNLTRKLLTKLGHLATRSILGLPYDASGGYRAYKVSAIDVHLLTDGLGDGYSWFYESLGVLHARSTIIVETPIVLPARTYGSSKMRIRDLFHSVFRLFGFRSVMKAQLRRIRT